MEVRQQNNSSGICFGYGAEPTDARVAIGAASRAPIFGGFPTGSDRQALMLRNVGLLWLALGAVMTALSFINGQEFKLSVWLWLGAACYAAYRFRTLAGLRVAEPSDQGHAGLIPDAEWGRILGEIQARRAMPRNVRDLVPRTSTLQQYRARFAWQHQQGRLSDAGLRHRLATVDALVAALDPVRK